MNLYSKTGKAMKIGDRLVLHGRSYKLENWEDPTPRHPLGFVRLVLTEGPRVYSDFYPTAIDATFR